MKRKIASDQEFFKFLAEREHNIAAVKERELQQASTKAQKKKEIEEQTKPIVTELMKMGVPIQKQGFSRNRSPMEFQAIEPRGVDISEIRDNIPEQPESNEQPTITAFYIPDDYLNQFFPFVIGKKDHLIKNY